MKPTIVQNGDPVLRKKAREVSIEEVKSAKIQKVLRQMQTALETQDDGVALAAPQIGHSLRIFIVSKLALLSREMIQKETKQKTLAEQKRLIGYLTFINPVLRKLSREKATVEEGCLSVRPLYGQVRRAKKAAITALDENGRRVTRGASGLLAQIFQHETDHLEGVLFTDKATDVRKLPIPSSHGS